MATKCDCCGEEVPEVWVAAVPGVPMSIAYCRHCLDNDIWWSYGICVIQGALCGGWDHMAPWAQETVRQSLNYFVKTRVQYDLDVAQEMVDLERAEADYWREQDEFERTNGHPGPEGPHGDGDLLGGRPPPD